MSQSRGELELTPKQIRRFAERIYRSVRQEVRAYANISDPELDRDFKEMNRQNVRIFFRALAEDRAPSAAELNILEASARRRLHQAIPLEAVFHSYRIGVRVLWQCLLEVAPRQDHGRLGALALEYADRASTRAARAYFEERQHLTQSRQDIARLLLTRIINEEAEDETAATREASLLGLDLTRPHCVLAIARAHDELRPSTESDLALAAVQGRLRTAQPQSLAVLLSRGLVAVLPADQVQAGSNVVGLALAEQGRTFVAGIGTAASGIKSLAASYREALRAQALGSILNPGRLVHRYEDLRLFDLFKEGEAMDAFVSEVLGPLLRLNGERRQRLAETLNAVFSSALNRKQAAHVLGIHPNTLSFRVRRIEELLGGSLIAGEFCFRVQLALRLLPLTALANHSRIDG
ncbi:MAG: PucR family transcriptional regulator [Chloroflexota bacterium]